MESWIIANEFAVRVGAFLGAFLFIFAMQWRWPRRVAQVTWQRVRVNLGLLLSSALLARLVLPWGLVAIAFWAQEQGWGLFNLVEVPFWIAVIASVFMMDFAIYVQHVLMHNVPILWRLHRLHHNDIAYDVTTSVRFHPLEIILSLLYKMALVVLLGVPPVAIVIFEVILNGMAMFTHANWALSPKFDRFLRFAFITPDTHRIHHSWTMKETNSNYGFHLNIWDRLFNTYRSQPEKSHEEMTIGLEYFRNAAEQTYWSSMKQPFQDPKQ